MATEQLHSISYEAATNLLFRIQERTTQLERCVFRTPETPEFNAEGVAKLTTRLATVDGGLAVFVETNAWTNISVVEKSEHGHSNGAETVQFSWRKQAKLEASSAELGLWLEAGRVAFERHQHLRPHRLPALGTVARMVAIATQFGRLACGLPWPGRRPPRPPEDFSAEAIPLDQALARG